ncbi:uncharacterized protein [Eurosta solidaginis]|uniref:uncharacterized protein n=1 Tax=Eurosta solidaginis TaxID=178769 RepID=UPI0035307067
MSSSTARCKCCDEVTEEMLTMRQTFEKLFHKLTKQIVDLRREVSDGFAKNKKSKRESSASPSRYSPPPTKLNRYNNSESETECYKLKADKKPTVKKPVPTKQEPIDHVEVKSMPKVSRPVLDFFNIQSRVIPTQPFKTADQFEDWNDILKCDEDQCDQLRVELLQGHFDEPDKYIKHIWRSIFKNEAAQCYSYRGNGRCKKRAIKSYIFTDIFRECFLQRFHHMDAAFFMEHTMRFFNYAHDHKRKTIRNEKKRQGNTDGTRNEEPVVDNDTTQDEQSYNGYEGSMLP